MRLLGRHLTPYRRAIALVIALLLLQAMGQLYLPSLNADIINDGVITGDTGFILRTGAIMLAITTLVSITSIVAVYFSARTAMGFGRDVRAHLFRHVEGFSLRELQEFGAPSLITRNTNDVQQVQMLVAMGLTMLISAPIMAIGGIVMAIQEDVQLSSLLLIIIPIMLMVIWLIVRQTIPMFRIMQIKIDRINLILREQLTGIRVIRAFVRSDQEIERFEDANDDVTRTALRVSRLFALMMPTLMLIFNLATIAIIWFGGHLVDAGSMPIGNLTAFIAYVTQILFAVMMAVMMVVMIPRAAASAERIQVVLDRQPTITESTSPPRLTAGTGIGSGAQVDLELVGYRYPGAVEPVLQGISLHLRPGLTTAIVGSTGSGKTTLLHCIMRLLDVTEGSVTIDGFDVREQPLESLWGSISLVPQRSMLFSGTIATNLRLGDPAASDARLWQALEWAQARDFVASLAEGLDAAVDQGGTNFSGGQRQRLAIARALVRRSRMYLFDDAFSALDYATDARLRSALRTATQGATLIMVAQRVTSIMHADQIVVLEGGRLVGVGTHDHLLDTCATYREIVQSQASIDDVGALR